MPKRVLRIVESTTIELPNGFQIHIEVPTESGSRKSGAGRPASPATEKLRSALQDDLGSGKRRTRAEYHQILVKAGHVGSASSAAQIVSREAKRVLGSFSKAKARPKRRGAGGRTPSLERALLREKLVSDQAAGNLGTAQHYLRWLVDQPKNKLGLRPARPIVYSELARVRKADSQNLG